MEYASAADLTSLENVTSSFISMSDTEVTYYSVSIRITWFEMERDRIERGKG